MAKGDNTIKWKPCAICVIIASLGFIYLCFIEYEIVKSYPLAGIFTIAAPGYAIIGWLVKTIHTMNKSIGKIEGILVGMNR